MHLPVSKSKVQLGEESGLRKSVEQICSIWNRVFVLDRYFVQCAVINANSQGSILLLLEWYWGAVRGLGDHETRIQPVLLLSLGFNQF